MESWNRAVQDMGTQRGQNHESHLNGLDNTQKWLAGCIPLRKSVEKSTLTRFRCRWWMIISPKSIDIAMITSVNMLFWPSNERLLDFSGRSGRSIRIRMGDRNDGKINFQRLEKVLCPDASCNNHFIGFQYPKIGRDRDVTSTVLRNER